MKMLKTNRLQAERCEIPKFNSTRREKKVLTMQLQGHGASSRKLSIGSSVLYGSSSSRQSKFFLS